MNEITVRNLCMSYIENSEKVTIWDLATKKEVFKGTYEEVMHSDFSNYSVYNYGIENGTISISISTETW